MAKRENRGNRSDRMSARERRQLEQATFLAANIAAQREHVSSYQKKNGSSYSLNKFKLEGKHKEVAQSMYNYSATLVQGVSGVGKTTTVVQTALKMLEENNSYNKIYFVKNPTESGDDKIGYLKGSEDDKLQAHFESMRGVFLEFMSLGALESQENNGNVEFLIPNFLQGRTLKNGILIIDEAQNMSPSTLKLVMERVGEDCILIVLGDKAQTYAVDFRKDGFTDFVHRVTKEVDTVDENGAAKKERISTEELFNYIELDSSMNKRSPLSKRITEIYS